MIPPLYILRHGETEWNRAGRMQGHADSPLTARGRAQAAAQGTILAAAGVTALGVDFFVSPLGRARLTAELALAPLGAVARVDPRIMEIGVGAWEGLTRDEIEIPRDAFAGYTDWYDAAPGGEGGAALIRRAASFLAELRRPSVVVTHGVAARILRSEALGCDPLALAAAPDGGQGWVARIAGGVEDWLGG